MENQSGKKVRGLEIGESKEDYLETMLVLSKTKTVIRGVDIAETLGFSNPSVSVAVKQLQKMGYVESESKGGYKLTTKGQNLAEKIQERHGFLKNFLIQIGVPEETAEKDACSMEHSLSDQSFAKLKEFARLNFKSL